MKTPLLSCLLLAVLAASSALAQTLPVPSSVQPSVPATVSPAPPPTAVPTQEDLDKLAAQAQKAVFDAAAKGGADAASTSGGPMNLPKGVTQMPGAGAPAARITTRGGSGAAFTTPPPAVPKQDDPSQWSKDSVHKLAVMDISFGSTTETVVIELYPNDAPQTVANFTDLCDSKFYDGLAFHRAIQNFIVQTGDPLTADEDKRDQWGTGGEDRSLPAEIKRTHRVGAVAMARRGDGVNPSRKSNGSQFYVSLGNHGSLDGKYTVFGQVISGLDVLQHISKMPVDSNDCPVARIEVDSVRVVDQTGPMTSLGGDGTKRRLGTGGSRGLVGRMLNRVW